ncbi:MAG: response regulator transcription factor [Chlorobi bacterium]|nr:response regulator transcription factor [Chlorobiota bacterium]MCI0716218.1 response regulator transcription factor [Chlorobiota bacterium]
MSKATRILIADDHPIFRKGVLSIVNDNPNIQVVGESSNGEEALKLINELKPDIVLLDIDMPLMSGLEVARILKKQNSKSKVVILTIHKDKEYFDEAIELDIKAYVLKDSIASDLVNCIMQVSEGEYYISPAISTYLIEKRRPLMQESPLSRLTATELQILKLISKNKTSSQIAEEMFRSIRTIENHRNNIINKLGLKGPHALLLFSIENKSIL